MSDEFTVQNGVRQGGILSPILFNVFIEVLSDRLKNSNVGCFINGNCFSHMFYADDSVLVAPSPSALQLMLDICTQWAHDYEMLFNVKKTKCCVFTPRNYGSFYLPRLYLNACTLTYVNSYKYLGVIINNVSDDKDIERQIQAVYIRGNMLLRKFRHCTHSVKCQLFRTYCSNMYGIHTWNCYKSTTFKRLSTAYNNIFRLLFNVPQRQSISHLYLLCSIDALKVLYRKCIFRFYSRLISSDNDLIKVMVSSDYFAYKSKTLLLWNRTLAI